MFDYVLAVTWIVNGVVFESVSPKETIDICEKDFALRASGREVRNAELVVYACVPIEDAQSIGIWTRR